MKGIKLILAAAMLLAVPAALQAAEEEFGARASWSPPTGASVKENIDQWLAEKELDEAATIQVEALWPKEGGPTDAAELLDQAAATFAVVAPETRELVDFCRQPTAPPELPEFAVLTDEQTDPFVRQNLRLLYARWLAQHNLYNEALEQLDGLDTEQVIDPATFLFYSSVGYHRLVEKEKCLPLLTKLLENEEQIPNRYRALAKLMEADIAPLKVDTLDEIARIMRNVHTRLEHGRAGKRVRKEEEDVVAKLDKIIEEMEKQAGGGGGGGGGAGSGNQPSSPMNDSNPGGGKGPGDVTSRDTGSRSGWGDLPPKEREAALTELSKDLPAHYRTLIEEYFRKLARDDR